MTGQPEGEFGLAEELQRDPDPPPQRRPFLFLIAAVVVALGAAWRLLT